MDGFNRVNDEFEIGYDEAFERRWYSYELIGRVVMVAFVAVALAGLLGRGPFSHQTAHSADNRLHVDYEPVARAQTPTTITLHVENPNPVPEPVTVHVNSMVVEPMGYQHATPLPRASTAVQGGMDMTFEVAPNEPDSLIRLGMQPVAYGPVRLSASVDGHSYVDWTMVVLP